MFQKKRPCFCTIAATHWLTSCLWSQRHEQSHWGICDEHTPSSCGLCPRSLGCSHLFNVETAEADWAKSLFVAAKKRSAALLVTAGSVTKHQKPIPWKLNSKAMPERQQGVVQYTRAFSIFLNSKTNIFTLHSLSQSDFVVISFCTHWLDTASHKNRAWLDFLCNYPVVQRGTEVSLRVIGTVPVGKISCLEIKLESYIYPF